MATLTDFVKANKPQGFTPRPFYSVEGDSLTFYFKDDPSYRERVDDFLTLYRSIKSEKLVGCQVKGLPRMLKLLGDFGLLIRGQNVSLGMLFIACMASTPEPQARNRYLELPRVARDATIPAKELEHVMA